MGNNLSKAFAFYRPGPQKYLLRGIRSQATKENKYLHINQAKSSKN